MSLARIGAYGRVGSFGSGTDGVNGELLLNHFLFFILFLYFSAPITHFVFFSSTKVLFLTPKDSPVRADLKKQVKRWGIVM